jgi:hypothetical protein
LNIEPVQNALREAFEDPKAVGVAVLKIPSKHSLSFLPKELTYVTFFLQQKLQQEGGNWVERAVSLFGFHATGSTPFTELPNKHSAELIRAMQSWVKVRQPRDLNVRSDIASKEIDLIDSLRKPSEHEISIGIRCAVWPLALIMLVPETY